ncbi:hypothetical protein K525DRAFT_285879 [Schizophyllum commune Loenen D]|nr:hypothetical protein K525DRAFT_285879 [Schizophyllum commune Loenen D]
MKIRAAGWRSELNQVVGGLQLLQPTKAGAKPVARPLQTFPMVLSLDTAIGRSFDASSLTFAPQVFGRSPNRLRPFHDAPPYPSAIYRLPREDGSAISSYASLALLNLWISLTGLAHAHLLACSEAAPILGEAASPHMRFGTISVNIHLAAIAAFVLAGSLNVLAGGWVGVQVWVGVRSWVGDDRAGGGNGRASDTNDAGSLAPAIFAAAVAGTLILAGAVNLAAANRVRRAGFGREGDEKVAGIGRKGRYAVIGTREKC